MKCWTFLVLQVLITAAEDTSVAPQQDSPCEVPELESTLIVEEETSGWGKKKYSRIPPGTQLLDKNNLFLKCEEGYEYNGRSLTRISCLNGHWDPAQPWCKEKPCRELPKVKNARVIGPVPHGRELKYTCKREYRLISTGITPYCWLGNVVGTLPKCHQTFCNETGFPKEAVHLILQKPVFYDGEYLVYECNHRFVSTHSKVKCTNGRWIPEDEQPFCKAKDCRLEDIPKIQNGFLEGTPNISHTSVIRFRCNEGYSSDGQQSMWCSYGKWEGRRPSCLKPTAPPHPDVGVQRGGGHDTNTYRASEDPYGIGSSAKSRPQLRSCKFPERKIRLYAADGNVRVLPNDNVAHGTVLRFHCRPLGEIRLVGNESSRCINGMWSSQVPYCYEREQYDVGIRLKDTAGTAVSPDGYLNIDPRFEVEMECESYYYQPQLEMIGPVSSWKRGGVRSILRKAPWRNHYMSAKFSLPEDYKGIVRCSNDNQYPTQIIKIRGRYLHSCKIPAHSDATVVTWVNKEIVTVGCRPPYVLRGEARAVCLAHSEWEKPFPECVLAAPTNIFNKPGNVNIQSAKPVLEQTSEILRLKATPAPGCDVTDFFTAAPSPVVINASASEVPLGAVFEAFCNDKGYILEGPSSRVTCKANGMWDFDPKMTCVKGCPNFADQDERLVVEGFLPKYYLGDSITLSCPNGTKLDPHVERITCLGDGWSETELPRCSDTEQENPKQKTRGSSKSRVSGVRRGGRSPGLPSSDDANASKKSSQQFTDQTHGIG